MLSNLLYPINSILEISIVFVILCMTLFWIFQKKFNNFLVGLFSFLCFSLMVYIILLYFYMDATYLFTYSWLDGYNYSVNVYQIIIKFLLVLLSAATLLVNFTYMKYDKLPQFEFIILVLVALFGMCVFVSCDDFLSFYLSFELQSFALYTLASLKRYDLQSTEAGFKYFLMGSFASVLLLFGVSLIYAYHGSINFEMLLTLTNCIFNQDGQVGTCLGLTLILICLFFKLPAAPFHTWAPDVYQGAPTSVVTFFVVVAKLAIISAMVQLLFYTFKFYADAWTYSIELVSLLSMIVGTIGALKQNNIKRFFAFSTVNHVGFMLLGFAGATIHSVGAIMFYIITYVVLSLNFFSLLAIAQFNLENGELVNLDDFSKLSKLNPALSILMCITLFSFAGIPPLAGFFPKLTIFMLALNYDLMLHAFIAGAVSVLSTFYYIRIVAIILFQTSEEKVLDVHKPLPNQVKFIAYITLLTNVLFIVYPQILSFY